MKKQEKLDGKLRKFIKNYGGYVYVLPVLIGIAIFTVLPMLTSLHYSLHDYDPTRVTNQLSNFGLQNYTKIFTTDRSEVFKSFYITFRYALVTVVVSTVGSYSLALFLNQKLKGVSAFRVIYYLPCIIPAVAGTLLWKDITNVNTGYINLIFDSLGLPRYTFYDELSTVFPTIIMLSVFSWGGNMVLWLAQMKNVPNDLYEAADLDGAGYFTKLFRITIPMTTSMLFYILIMGIINSLQAFGGFYPLRNGVNDAEINFVVIKIYSAAFEGNGGFSYACALSWMLFVVIGIITMSIFKTSKWVYYGEEM